MTPLTLTCIYYSADKASLCMHVGCSGGSVIITMAEYLQSMHNKAVYRGGGGGDSKTSKCFIHI